jgi:hypothetical protein
MSTVLIIERVRHLGGSEKPPVFAEVEKTIAKIQRRAFWHFEQRGELPGSNATHSHSEADGEIRFCGFSEEGLCRQFDLPSEGVKKSKSAGESACATNESYLLSMVEEAASASLNKGMLIVVAAKANKTNTKVS